MSSRGRRSALIVASLALLLAASASPAHAQGFDRDLLPWPELLPPSASVDATVQPGPVRRCRRATIRCVGQLAKRLRNQVRRYDASCDHRAVTAFSYLMITRGLRRDLAGRGEGIVAGRRWMTYLITDFSNRYVRAFRRDLRGRPVAEPWRIFFEAADRGDFSAAQDVLLFSNAHVQHDLPFALERMGLRLRSGASRKPDHDAVNAINAAVFGPIERRIAERYDPFFELFTALPLPIPLEQVTALELVKLWRETAWRSAERLLSAPDRAARDRVAAQIERTSAAWARLITSVQMPGLRQMRDEHCRAATASSGR